ncbi:alpha/beta fold hydrolase [Myxosarcina sp. GI1(2024)]
MKISQATAPVWINANPSFKHFDGRIVRYLSNQVPIAYWEYRQEPDDPSSLDTALCLLHDYLQSKSQPIDLIGHGTGGLLGLLYARQYSHKVKSLTILGVGSNPASDWQAHYYQMRKLLSCSQEIVLARMVQMMFGHQDRINTRNLVKILQRDLYTAPTAHSLYQLGKVKSGGVSMPLMICGSENDGIVTPPILQGWSDNLKDSDVLWVNPLGHHFFHYFFPEQVGRQVIKFWQRVNLPYIKVSSRSAIFEETLHHYC